MQQQHMWRFLSLPRQVSLQEGSCLTLQLVLGGTRGYLTSSRVGVVGSMDAGPSCPVGCCSALAAAATNIPPGDT